MLDDMLTQKQSIQVTYKEFLGWSRLCYGMDKITFAGLPARTVLYRTAQTFRDIGMRFTKYN